MELRMITGVVLLATSINSHADAVHELDQLNVYARPYGMQSVEHIATPFSILSGEQLKDKMSNTIGETLSEELGVTASDFGQGSSRPIIRGLGGQRLQVMQGGISSMDISTISVDHNVSLSPFNASQIEILRGPAALLYGNGASAGVINIVNDRIPEYLGEFEAELGYSYNTAFDGDTYAGRANGSHDKLAFHVDFMSLETENYEAEVGEILNSDTDTTDVNFGASLIDDWGFLGFSVGRYDTTYGVPFNPEEPDELVFIDMDQTRVDFAGQLNDPLPWLNNIRIRGAHNDYAHTEFEGPGEPGTEFFNDEWEGRLEANHKAFGPWSGVVGVQARTRSFAAIGEEAFVQPTKLKSVGLFIYEDTDWNDLHIEIGGRYEFQNVEPTSTTGINDIDHDTYSLSFGSVYRFSDRYTAGLTISRAQRAPAIEELIATGPHHATETFEIGNPFLDEETANNIDVSVQRNGDAWSWKANLFANYIEDYIFGQSQDTNGDGEADEVDEDGNLGGEFLLIRFAQDDALFYGAEFETTWHMELGANHFDIRLFTDIVRAEFEGGDDVPRISPARLGLGIDYSRNAWSADLDLINVFEQDDTAELEEGTGGYVMLNTGLAYTLPVGDADARFFVRGTNLLDRDARRHTSFIKERAPLPGRAAMLGVRLSY